MYDIIVNMSYTFIFFDTETTGVDEKDRLCQLAYVIGKNENNIPTETYNELFRPSLPIPPEASAVTHITNKMVADKPAFTESNTYRDVKELFEREDVIVIAHNAKFDISMLAKENIFPKNFVCTLKLARYLDPENKLPQYKLQYLRYLLEIEIEAQAHDALGDVLVLEKLFERLYQKVLNEEKTDDKAIAKMLEVSNRPSMITNIHFGKYIGQKIADVAVMDKRYLEWLYNEKLKSDKDEEDWLYTLEYYLK